MGRHWRALSQCKQALLSMYGAIACSTGSYLTVALLYTYSWVDLLVDRVRNCPWWHVKCLTTWHVDMYLPTQSAAVTFG